jgi:hypothetical protein
VKSSSLRIASARDAGPERRGKFKPHEGGEQ